ncbi:MAG: thermonuclease family protein [Peptostreptococcaceae bacterium]
MKLQNKFKSIFLPIILTLSIFLTGCSGDEKDTSIINPPITDAQTTDVKDPSPSSDLPKDAVLAIVERVVDGDTVKVKIKETNEIATLRLLLVDTPESVKPGVEPQPFSLEASDFAKKTLAVGDKVYIEYDNGDKTDKYDRHLSYLWFYCEDDSTWEIFNEKLISKGYARVGYIYSQKRHLDRFYKAQDKAKSDKLNIWSIPGYVTDKGFDVEATGSSSSDKETSSNKSENSSTMVYANGGSSSSNKYHSSATAHNMKGAVKMTESKAKSSGYVPCGLCY